MCEKHCGYTNYQTFTVALHVESTRSEHEHWREVVAGLQLNAHLDKPEYYSVEEYVKFALGDMLKEAFANPLEDDASVYSTLLGDALGRVDWVDVAESFLTE